MTVKSLIKEKQQMLGVLQGLLLLAGVLKGPACCVLSL